MKLLGLLLTSFSLYGSAVDPYGWLMEMESERTLKWTTEQNAKAEDYLKGVHQREEIREMLEVYSDYENYGLPVEREGRLFFFKRERGAELHDLMVRENGEDRVLVRSEVKGPLNGFEVSADGKWVTYGVSDAGSDKQVWRFINVDTGARLCDELEGIQFTTPIWGEGGVFYVSYLEGAIYFHELGGENKRLFQINDDKKMILGLTRPNQNTLLFIAINGWSRDNAVYICDLVDGTVKEIVPYDLGQYRFMGAVGEKLLFLTDHEADHNKLVVYDGEFRDFLPDQEMTLIEASVFGEEVFCHYLDHCVSVIERYSLEGEFLGRVSLPGKGTVTLSEDSPYYAYTDTVTPKGIYHFDEGAVFIPTYKGAEGFVTEQHFFSSKDGTLVPLFITHKANIDLTGDHPTLLYGYGGFNIPLTPRYSPLIHTWLELGGIYVSANLRGGGEYGKKWHEAGTLDQKQNVFDDFIGAAEYLISKGYTSANNIGINGRSNGGLLVGACLVQRPDLFGAAVPQVCVLDMLEFNHFTCGWSWTSDYGNPDDPEDFPYLYAYSPYHNVKEGVHYPPTLITTADHDDRVVPMHSYKFAARLSEVQEGENPILLRVYTDTGHGVGRSFEQIIEENTDILSFLIQELEPLSENLDLRGDSIF